MKLKKNILTILFLILTGLMLSHSQESLCFALAGLKLWFTKMIPTLLPFMMLSGIMVRMNLTERFGTLLYPVFYPLFHLSKNAVYCIVMGFLCGFPMGARVITELYERKRISREEASWLLAFCNNIGPVYFMGFVLPMIARIRLVPYLFGMYGLPLLYGWVLRLLKRFPCGYPDSRYIISSQSTSSASTLGVNRNSFFYSMDEAVQSAIEGITSLGGYMILFNLFNLFPHILVTQFWKSSPRTLAFLAICNGFLEITGGISRMGAALPLAVLLLLPFGGLSCIAQTYSIIKRTDLSMKEYILHKTLLSILTCMYYFGWYLINKSSFLS